MKGAVRMTNISITNFKNNLSDYLKAAIDFDDVITVNTENGNAVILSEEEYSGLMETLYLQSIPEMKERLIDGLNTGLEDCVEFEW